MRLMRCSDGHVFPPTLAVHLLSVHFGASRFGLCPVDKKLRSINRVSEDDLTEEQLHEVQQRYG